MELKSMKLTITLIVGLIGVVHGKAIAGAGLIEVSASQQTLFRRNPNLFVQSQGYGGGSGDGPSGGMSSTSLQFNNANDPNNTGGLSVQSNAVGAGGPNGGGMSSTGLQFQNNGNYPNNNGLSVQSNAVGAGGPDGGGGMSSTSLQFNNAGNYPNNNGGLSVQSNAVGAGGPDGGGGMSSTGLQFNNGGNYPNNNGGLSVQSNAVGGGGPGGGGGMSSTGLQFSNDGTNPNNNGLSVQSNAVGGGGPGGGGGMSSTSLQFNNDGSCDGSNPNHNGLSVQSNAVGAGGPGGGGGMSSTSLQFNNDDATKQNNGLSVQSNAVGVGGGDNSLGASPTTLQTTDNPPPKPDQQPIDDYPPPNPDQQPINYQPPKLDQNPDKLKVQNDAVAVADSNNGAVGATHTTVDSSNKDGDLKVDNTAVGVASGDQAVGLANTQVHENDKDKTVDVNNTALAAGDNAGAVTNTSVQEKNANGDETKVNTASLVHASGPDAVGATQTTVQIDKDTPAGAPVPLVQPDTNTVQVQNAGIATTDQNGAVGLSTNSVHIDDDKEGDIDLKTLAAGSSNNGGTGASSVGVQMADGADKTPNNDLTVTSTNTAIGHSDSDQSVGGSVSTVHVDDKKNERSLEAQTIGLGYKDNTTTGTLTADSMKYHDVDQENHTVVNPENNSVFQSSNHEVNDISSQNVSSQYNTVDNDSTTSTTTHSTTTQTQQTQVMQQSYYTEQQVVNQQNQGYIVANQDQQVDRNLLVSQQQSQNIVQNQQSQSLVQNQQSQHIVQNQESQSLIQNQQSQNIVQNQESQNLIQNQSQVTSTQQTQTVDQSQSSYFGSHQIIPNRHQASPMLCPDNNQGPGVVCHYEVASVFEYDSNYILRPSQIVTEYCDVLIVSYAVLDVERLQIGAFSQDEERIFTEIAGLRSDKLKIILQLQYVAFYEQYITILNCDDNLNKFTSSLINYLNKWNFDGIELPIMVPQSNDKFYETSPVIKEKFPILVQKLRSNLGNDHIISVCLPIEPDYIDFAYDIPKLVQLVDWFSVITLDYNVPDQGILQHASPLTPQTSSDPYCIDFTVNYLLSDLKVPSDKLIINVRLYGTSFVVENYKNPTYGTKVTGKGPKGPSSNVDGFLTISELCSLTQCNWLNNPAIVTDYDDVPGLVLKVTYARSKCLGGVGIHSISMDDPAGRLCGQGVMPFTKVISMAYDPTRDIFGDDDNLEVINYINKSTTNKYEV